MDSNALPPSVAEACADVVATMQEAEDRLRMCMPMIVDLSVREPAVGIAHGHVVEDKMRLLALAREAGFDNIVLAAFNAPDLGVPQVDELFCQELLDRGQDLTGTFAFTAPGRLSDGAFVPDASMQMLARLQVPNTIVDLQLASWHRTSDGVVIPESDYVDEVLATVEWLTDPANIVGDGGAMSRVFLNVQDGLDAFLDDWAAVARVCFALAKHSNVAALTFEDGKGTAMPFQVSAVTRLFKAVAGDKPVLVHMHAGSGLENANMIEAMLAGADGIWAGFVREAATNGHAPTSEFLANLARLNNRHVERYALDRMVPIANEMTEINTLASTGSDVPFVGSNAYRTMLTYFMQDQGRPMDLAPERIGAIGGWRVTPVVSDNPVVRGRLRECDPQIGSDALGDDVITRMRSLMRRDLVNGLRLSYDEPETLLQLHRRALDELPLAEER